MNDIYRPFLSIVIFVAAFFIGVSSASGQIVFKRNSNVVSTQTQPSPDAWKPLPASAVTGTVRAQVVWSKALGLPPMYPGASETYPMPCGLVVISVSNMRERIKSSEGGEIATDRSTGAQLYICSYTIEGLPKGEQLSVNANFVDTRVWETAPWNSVYSAEGAAPGAGQIRVLNGDRFVTLSDAEPTINVDFSIRYETPRRPRRIF